MTTLQAVELGVLGPLQVRQDGAPVAIPGAKPRAVLTMLGLHHGSVVSADALVELLWGEDPPRTAAKALQTHISSARRALGDGFVLTQGTGWALAESEVDASRYMSAARLGRDAAATGDISQAVAHFEEALALWRGIPELPDGRRGTSEKTRWVEGHAALVEDRADALLATARAAEIIGELEAAVAEAPLRERRWGQLMLALYRAGRQGDALGAYQRARTMLADELGIDPGPELRRLETAIVAQDATLDVVVAQHLPLVMRAVTFLLTDIEGSTAAWEADAAAMAVALARHDELVEQVVTSRGGRLIKTRGEGDATFSVFERPSAAAAAAMELQDAITHEQWGLREPMRIRIALHTGEVELRDGDYFGRAVNRAARLRSLAVGGQILCSGATAELVIDSLPDDVVLADLGLRELRNLARPEHVFELRLETAEEVAQPPTSDAPPMERPGLPSVLIGSGPFVGRGSELEQLLSAWQTSLGGGACAALIAGEPGVGKTRLAGEWSRKAYEQGAVVLYGRCDEDLGAPYQPFAEALRSLVPCVGTSRLRGLRGVEALLPLVPGLVDDVPDLAAPTRADPDTERYALFDAVVALLEMASKEAPVVLVLDDLHWAAKPTLLLLRHLLRFGDRARVQIVGTYRSTDLDRSHPLAAMLADLHRDGTANRINLSGLDEDDVSAYVAKAGYDDEELGHALASVTGGNPFFLIEALRHVDESGGVWDPSTLPQGVREAVSRRLSRLPIETNKALAAAAVVGSRFALDLVERVVGDDLVDAFDEASKAGIVIEEPGGRYRFNHAIVRQSLLAELPSMRRMRLHQRIATTLEDEPGAGDELLAELAHHYFECAWAGNAVKAVEYCRRAADQAMARLAYEGAAELYDHALHALEELDDELPDRDDQSADLLVARCEALLAAGDVASAAGAVSQLQQATVDSARLSAWATCFDGQLSVLVHPERLDDVEAALDAAAHKLAEIDDAAGEAKAHTVRATCLARLGRIGDCEIALDDALTAARRARDHRRVNAVLAGAPLAALWGPNPVPRAGGRCLDVVRLLRITTDSPAVEATSTRCQAVLEAFRGRDAAARRMIDSARRTVTELGLRHALLEVEQFAGIVELVLGDPAAAEPHLRQACNGFRRMGLDADTAETAALLGRACLALNRDAEADELCTESERLAGHALKASIAWRTLRAQLLSRSGEHNEARRVAQAAITLAERTDGLVDHGDACLSLAKVLGAAGDAAGARAAAERAASLYERKGAVALADKARSMLDERAVPPVAPAVPEVPNLELDNAAVRVGERVMDAIHRQAWDEFDRLFAPDASIESRRKVVGLTLPSDAARLGIRREVEMGTARIDHVMIAARGERLALSRLITSSADVSPGAPYDELLQLYTIDETGRVALQIWFDVEDIDAAIAELDALQARFEDQRPPARRLENAASRLYERFKVYFAARDWRAITEMLADNVLSEDRRGVVNSGLRQGRDALIAELSGLAEVGMERVTSDVIAIRGAHLVLSRIRVSHEAFHAVALDILELDADERFVARIVFDLDDFDAAIAELDARYLAGEAAAHAHTWSAITGSYASVSRHELPAITPDCVAIDHRRATALGAGPLSESIRAGWDLGQDIRPYVEAVHRLSEVGAVCSYAAHGVSHQGFDAEWQGVNVVTVDGEMVNHTEFFDEADLDAAIARFDQLSRPARRLENAASQAAERYMAHFAARDWDALAKVLADDMFTDNRRRVVNEGIKHGRDAEIANLRAAADVGITYFTSVVIAARGERLILARVSGGEGGSGEFLNEGLGVVEINSHSQIAAIIAFDLEDFDAAIAELDARYLAGEAPAHAHTWSAIVGAYGAINRRELPSATPDFEDEDHRRGAAFATGDMIEYLRAGWDLDQDISFYVEAVHRLSDLGAVVTHKGCGTSREGFDAEWREVMLFTADGDSFSRCEVFDEADVDDAVARFDQLSPPAPRLENAASRVNERLLAQFVARDWDAMVEALAEDVATEDRRRVVNSGVRLGRDTAIKDFRAAADLGVMNATAYAIATRGQRLVLVRSQYSRSAEEPEAFGVDFLGVVEIDADDRIAAWVTFDADDFEAGIAELDARYQAGEAAAYSRTWSVIAGGHAALNRHELPPTTPDCVSIDHRRGAAFAPGDLIEYFRAGWELGQDIRTYVEVVHRLSELGAVCTHAGHGVSHEGFDAEWHGVDVLTVEGDMVNRCEAFDDADLDAAIARFDQLSQPVPRLENAASRANERSHAYFAARDWDAIAEIVADDISTDDRRRVVNAGLLHGRDATIESFRWAADLGVTHATSDPIATRGERLVLTRTRYSHSDDQPQPFDVDLLHIVEINVDERIGAVVIFDLEDFAAAFAELDARYLAGPAAPHARTWSVIMQGYASLNRRELPPTTPDWVNVDHRRGTSIAPGGIPELLTAAWNVTSDLNNFVEAVHRLDNLGGVVTHVANEASQEGFHAEWRVVSVFTVEGDMVNRCEVFDEAAIDDAIARFDQLSRPAPRPENTASRANARFLACVTARDWDAVASILADDFCSDDRRRVTGAGTRRGRDAEIENMRVVADLGANITVEVIATRGDRLVLTRARFFFDQQQQGFVAEVLSLVETDLDGHIAATILLESEDIKAAFEELDARYLAGEAAAHARTWSVISGSYAAINRHEMPLTTPDCANIDHRRETAMGVGDLIAYISAGPDRDQDNKAYVEAVHRLTEHGAVVTYAAHETSQEGFDAEWRGIAVFTVEGELINRTEVFDEADLDAAIASFDQLSRPGPRLENAAGQVAARFVAHFAAGDWDAMAEILADNFSNDDRRRIVGAGIRHGRDAQMANTRALAELYSTKVTRSVIATRGRNLVLERITFSRRDEGVEGFLTELLMIIEINADEKLAALIVFDLDDFDAAIAELDARYLAGEAATHAHTWSLVAAAYACYNRRELPATTPDWVNVDRRRMTMYAPGDVFKYVRGGWDYISDISFRIEAVHQLSNLGAVVTHAGRGTSQEGFDAEWREIHLMTVEGDLFNRSEMFDEADLDGALARFDELQPQTPRLENAASRVDKRFQACFTARDWDLMAKGLSDGFSIEDRRRVVNMGNSHGRDAELTVHAYATVGTQNVKSTVIATRAQRLALNHYRFSGRDQRPDAFRVEMLAVVEIDAEERMAAVVVFDADDFDAAIAELDARYLAGEAAAHSHTWSVIRGVFAALNRRELPSTTTDLVDFDHRKGTAFASGELMQYLRAGWEVNQEVRPYVEVVHRLNNLGAVITHSAQLTSREGFEAEWRTIDIMTVDGDLINRAELFDEADLDTAIARFERLSHSAPRLENAASQAAERFRAHFAAGDWDAAAEILADDFSSDDRRRVVGAGVRHGRHAEILNMQAIVGLGITIEATTVMATRGERLVLVRSRFALRDPATDAFVAEVLGIAEIDTDNRITAHVVFDLDDIDAAIAELDTRYLAGEGAVHSHTWSVISQAYAALNRRALPATTPDWTNVDHRHFGTIETNALTPNIRAFWDLTSEARIDVATVHRLTNLGAVVAHATHATSQEGVEIESGEIIILMVDRDLLSRCEIFNEADLDAALARFEELHPQTPRLENPASQVTERFQAHFAARDWAAMGEILADGFSSDDRRRVVGAGVRDGRQAEIADMAATADLGITHVTSTVVATRGGRLALMRGSLTHRDQGPEAYLSEALGIVEIDAYERIVAFVTFDLDDFDAAFEELDARYLAGEAAAHAQTWSLVVAAYAAFDRHELPAADWVTVDHRRATPFASSTMTESLRAIWDLTPDLKIHIEAVHRLNSFGAVITHEGHGSSQEGFDAEWRAIDFLTVEGDRITGCEIFDEADLDAALTRFEELHPQTRRLENAASQAVERFWKYFAAREWAALAETMADDICSHDRRRVVNGGELRGRADHVTNMRAVAEVGFEGLTSTVIASRGQHLTLIRIRSSMRGSEPGEVTAEMLSTIEIDTDNRLTAAVIFGGDDFGAAIKELDARYLAGEASAYAHTWSRVVNAFAAINRHELPELSSDWVNVDHRRGAAFAAGEMTAYLRDLFDDVPDIHVYAEVVHRLGDLGAVVTQAGHGTSQEGFQAEWREIGFFIFDGDLLSRYELFDETDLDAALARFDELQPQARRPENGASQVVERFWKYFAARHWDAMAETMADDFCTDDRRRVANAGVLHGRAAHITNMRAVAEVGFEGLSSTVIATRGQRLALIRFRTSMRGSPPGEVIADVVGIVEIDADNRLVAAVHFDSDDIDAAFEELEARYLVGEAAAHAHIWTAITKVQAAYNRHEVPPTTADCVNIDHRPGIAFAPGDATAYIGATYDVAPNVKGHLEAVHRLGNLGVVVTEIVAGTSQDGFAFEWREVALFAFEGDLVCRFELFDETDLDTALARFDELQLQARRVENAATQVSERFLAQFAAGDWDAMPKMMADNFSSDDRRRVVGAGVRHGRNAQIMDMRAIADLGITNSNATHLATRGKRLALSRTRMSGKDQPFYGEMLDVLEINADAQIVKYVLFDPDDVDVAFAELDARYLAGEAAPHAHTWSLVMQAQAAWNRHEFVPNTEDWVNVDHRRGRAFAPGELKPFLRATWSVIPDANLHTEAVHRLINAGVVCTVVATGTSQEGFDAEWREIALLTFDGELLSRCELFDETDLDAALARFDELQPQAPRLENAASQVGERFWKHFAARDWAAMAELIADDIFSDDRRRVVNGGIRRGRGDHMADMRAIAEVLPDEVITPTVIATRGARLALTRICGLKGGLGPGEVTAELFSVVELDADNRIVSHIGFDIDDIDAAFEELDARYLAGEAAAHSHTWTVNSGLYAGFNRHELPATTPDWTYIDHRPLVTIEANDLPASMRAIWDLAPDISIYMEAVDRLSDLGAVVTAAAYGSSQEGFDAEWRMIDLFTVEGDLISRCEIFDEADLDAALARFEELHPPTRRLENAASRADDRFFAYFRARNWAGLAEILADESFIDDRRPVVNAGLWDSRDVVIANLRAVADAAANITSVIATRGKRLALSRIRSSNRDPRQGEFGVEMLNIVEIDTEGRIAAHVEYDPDDIDAAVAELDARYLAGEAAGHARTWSAVMRAYTELNRGELPTTTPDFEDIDHRRAAAMAPGELIEYLRAALDQTPELSIYIEAVHLLSDRGAIVTHAAHGISREGFDAERREVSLVTAGGDTLNRCELFDETDLDAALARFDEIDRQASSVEQVSAPDNEGPPGSYA